MKKSISYMIVILILIINCLIAAFPTSATDINYDDFDIIDGVLLEYVGPGGDVVVPAVDEDGNPVTRIDTKAFYGNTDVTSVVVPEGIEELGNSVFQDCTNLTEVTLPYSLHTAEYNTFKSTALMSIVIPGNLRVIPSSFVVAPCADIVISPGVEEFKVGALYVGKACSELIFPESVYKIAASAFCYFSLDTSLYFCNPDIELGEPSEYAVHTDKTSAIIWNPAGREPKYKFYCLDDSTVEEFVKEYQQDTVTTHKGEQWYVNASFIKVSQEKLDELEEQCEERGITKAPVTDSTGDKNGTNENGNNSSENNTQPDNNANSANSQGSSLLLIVIIAAATVVIIAVCVMVVILVVLKNKRKKKDK